MVIYTKTVQCRPVFENTTLSWAWEAGCRLTTEEIIDDRICCTVGVYEPVWEGEPRIHRLSVVSVLKRPKDSAGRHKAISVKYYFLYIDINKTMLLLYSGLRTVSNIFNLCIAQFIFKQETDRMSTYKTKQCNTCTPVHPFFVFWALQQRAAESLPFHDIEHADWQIAQGKDKENHHQHTGGLPPSSDLFDLSANCVRLDPHGLRLPCSLSRALDGPPLPLQHRCASRYLVVKYVQILDGWDRTEEDFSFDTWLCIHINLKNTYLLEPQLVTYLNICQDHET